MHWDAIKQHSDYLGPSGADWAPVGAEWGRVGPGGAGWGWGGVGHALLEAE